MTAKPNGPRRSTSVFSAVAPERDSWWKRAQTRPITGWLGFIGFSLGLVLVILGGFEVSGHALSDAIIGRPALRDYPAPRDFTYVEENVEATREQRQRSALAVPPVYDWDEGIQQEIVDQIHRAFEAMRERAKRAAEPGEPAGPLARLEAARSARAELFDAVFPAEIPEADFDALARAGFAPRLEGALTSLVHDVMSGLVVSSTRRLDADRERGLYLRRIRDNKIIIEYHVTDLRGRFTGADAVGGVLREMAAQRLSDIDDPALRAAIVSIARRVVRPNTTPNEAITQEKRQRARALVPDVVERTTFRRGQPVVARGEIVTARHVAIWRELQEEISLLDTGQVIAGVLLLCLAILVTLLIYGQRNLERFRLRPRDLAFCAVAMLGFLGLARATLGLSRIAERAIQLPLAGAAVQIPAEFWFALTPVAGAAMLVRLTLRPEHAVVFSVIYALLLGLMVPEAHFFAVFSLVGSLVGAHFVDQVKRRLALLWSGAMVGLTNVFVLIAFLLIEGQVFEPSALLLLVFGFVGGFASFVAVSALLPLIEAGFGYTTDIKLLELANLDHPLLRELILRAPGSYHHSMMVGSLCEAGAEEVGCNALLARVGAYYHDIGKAKNPGYFAENQRAGENPHDKLKPNMSALIIKAHVKDGVEMGRQHRLPKEIMAFIQQHHGTSLIAYFFHKAKQLEDPNMPQVDEADYRYPGPKPQTRETAICLLADGVEAASRAMSDKTPARLKGLVHTMINRAFSDGQLDECDLTLRDLNAIAIAFTRILTGIYHHRPQYPGPSKPAQSSAKAGGERSPDRARSVSPRPAPDAARSPAAEPRAPQTTTKEAP